MEDCSRASNSKIQFPCRFPTRMDNVQAQNIDTYAVETKNKGRLIRIAIAIQPETALPAMNCGGDSILRTRQDKEAHGNRMAKTPIDLYRKGNASSPRIDNVRAQDIDTYEQDGQTWVKADSGGISTLATLGSGKNRWKLNQGTEIPRELNLVNENANHWLFEPSYNMPMELYQKALISLGKLFYKVS